MSALRHHIRYLSTFGLASIFATLMDLVVFSLLVRQLSCPVSYAAALGAFTGALVHFSLCHSWVFSRNKRSIIGAAWRYFLTSFLALLAHTAITTTLARQVNAEVAWTFSKVLVFVCLTYPVSRYFVFAQSKPHQPVTKGSLAVAHQKPPRSGRTSPK